MSVQSATSRADYTGNGATTTFSVPFYFLLATDIRVILQDHGVVPVIIRTLSYPAEYSVTGDGNPSGGSITITVAPTTQQQVSILRNVELTQLSVYVPNDPFPAKSHETALDKLTMIVQQLQEQLSRCVQAPFEYGQAISGSGQTLFTTPSYTPGTNSLFVIRGGVVLTNGMDYEESSSTSITMTTGDVIAGEVFVFRIIQGAI